jgi:16S rRNA processing protein RimM
MSSLLAVGFVQRPHGLDGEVSVHVLTDFPERFSPGSTLTWRRGDERRELRLAAVRPHGKRLLLSFDSVVDVEAARELQGGELCVAESDAFPAPEGFFYSHEIRGWACEDATGRRLGVATGVEDTPAGPLLSVEVRPGKEALVPFVHPIVLSVDREAGRIVLDPPEGLLDL